MTDMNQELTDVIETLKEEGFYSRYFLDKFRIGELQDDEKFRACGKEARLYHPKLEAAIEKYGKTAVFEALRRSKALETILKKTASNYSPDKPSLLESDPIYSIFKEDLSNRNNIVAKELRTIGRQLRKLREGKGYINIGSMTIKLDASKPTKLRICDGSPLEEGYKHSDVFDYENSTDGKPRSYFGYVSVVEKDGSMVTTVYNESGNIISKKETRLN
ncbi:hypothetical protein KY330_02535 [Candidatus Woesearchaeota archaeon]|nr:hypothetical protein [Candidatus Woesearchaeota archaeon]